MKIKYLGILVAAASLALGGCAEIGGGGDGGDPVELVIGTDSNTSDLFKMGNGLATAVALNSDALAVYNYATKGSKDNLKRIAKKKRAINLAAVRLKELETLKKRQAIEAVVMLGSTRKNPDWVALVVRARAPKGVSKEAYKNAIYELVKVIYSEKARKTMQKSWKRWAPNRAAAIFESVGIKYNAGAIQAFNELVIK